MPGFTLPITLPLTWQSARSAQFYAGEDRDLKVKVFISRPDGVTWTDITSYVTYIHRRRGDVASVGTGQTGADVMSQTCTVRIANARRRNAAGELVGDSFHPLVRTSPWNQWQGAYAPLLFPRREIVIDVAAVPVNTTPGPVDWVRMFHGYLGDGIDADASSSEIVVECRDVMKLLMDTFIEVKRTYGSEAGTPAEVVMQQIIDDNMANGPRIYCPISPGLMIKPYELGDKSVADALVEIANQCGWWIGGRWLPDYNDFRLTFMAPPRGKDASHADWSFDWTRDILMQTLRIADREIRNVVCLTFRDEASGMRKTVMVWDQPSIDAYGRRAMGIKEGDTSLINTVEEANAMAEAALHDQKDLPALTEIELPFLPTLDIFDGILINNPLLSSTQDFYAVSTAEDVLEVRGDKLTARTRVVAAGRVMGGLWKWRRMETRPGSPGKPVDMPPPFTVIVAAKDSPMEEREKAQYFCDGVADEEQINAAINSLASTGGTVQLLVGTYVISASISIGSKVRLCGRGPSTVIMRASNMPTDAHMIVNADSINGNSDIVIADLKVEGDYPAIAGPPWPMGILLTKVQRSTVQRVWATKHRGHAIALFTSSNNIVANNTCADCQSDGIFLTTGANGNNVTGNICIGNHGTGLALQDDSDNNVVSSNTCSAYDSGGIWVGSLGVHGC
ncbi:MAG: right-handed parallel beta-helix repeat-containing protein, partial [Betaproteobacteria bacterium]